MVLCPHLLHWWPRAFRVFELPTREEIEAFDPCPLTDSERSADVMARGPIDEPPGECRAGGGDG